MPILNVNKCVLGALLTFASLSLSGVSHAETLHFGEALTHQPPVAVSALLASPEEYLDKTVTIEGTVVGVCSMRGCWADIASDARFQKLRLKVQDGDMVFPMHAKGRKAIATGKLYAVHLSQAQTQRYLAALAKRNGEEFDPNTVTEGMAIYQVEPVAVDILD